MKFISRPRCAKNEQVVQLTVIHVQGSHDQLKITKHVKTISEIHRKKVEVEVGI